MAHEADEQSAQAQAQARAQAEAEAPGPEDATARRPLDLARARRSAIDAVGAYRAAKDPASLAAVYRSLSEDVPAHWLVTGLLSVSSQLVEYLAASEKVDPADLLQALASLDLEDELDGGTEPALGPGDEDALVDEQGEESFPASDPPANWAGEDDPAGT